MKKGISATLLLAAFLFIFAMPMHTGASGPNASAETASQLALPEGVSLPDNFQMLAASNLRPLDGGSPSGRTSYDAFKPPGMKMGDIVGVWEFGRERPSTSDCAH